MEKTLGLDLGTNSIGWAYIDQPNENERPHEIAWGAYVFPEAGELESGLFVSHRSKHGDLKRMRRNLRRKRERRDGLVSVLISHNMLPSDSAERTEFMCLNESDPYKLRRKGLDEELTLHEFGRVLFHINRRRGYLSTALLKVKSLEWIQLAAAKYEAEMDIASADTDPGEATAEKKETSKLLLNMRTTREKMREHEARTLGEFYAKHLFERASVKDGETPAVRGYAKKVKDAKGKQIPKNPNRSELGYRADRTLFEEEFEQLWTSQARFHPELTNGLKGEIWQHIFYQRPLKSKAGMVGKCTILPNRKRLAKATLLAQRTVILRYLANLRIHTTHAEPRRLTGDEVKILLNLLENNRSISWEDARTALMMGDDQYFNDEPNLTAKRGKKTRGKSTIPGNITAHLMRGALTKMVWDNFNRPMPNSRLTNPPSMQEELVSRLIFAHDFSSIAGGLKRDFELNDLEIFKLAQIEFPSGYLNLCAEVTRNIEPYLLDGKDYYEACVAAGYDPTLSDKKSAQVDLEYLPKLPDLRNPVVQRSADAAIKVINAFIRKYGKPDRINIEMPRDVSRTNSDRESMWQAQDKNAKENKRVRELITSNGFNFAESAFQKQIKKVRLWEEAGERCPYFPNDPFTLAELLDNYDIDHIVPRSICYDDSLANLTICPKDVNIHEKAKQTPYGAWGLTNRWKDIVTAVNGLRSMYPAKKARILCERDYSVADDNDQRCQKCLREMKRTGETKCKLYEPFSFTNRMLVDTQYASRLIREHVTLLGIKVGVSRGQLTAELRNHWGLAKVVPVSEDEQTKLNLWRGSDVKKDPKPRFDHRHHALDALITALVDTRTLQQMTRWYKEKERGMPNDKIPRALPWPTIKEDLTNMLDACLVVHASTRSLGGALHEQTALKADKRPSSQQVQKAYNDLPDVQKSRVGDWIVVGGYLVRFSDNFKVLQAYKLGNNHHATVWESTTPNRKGHLERTITVTSTIEASRRAINGEALFSRQKTGYRYLFSVCENDIVQWTGDFPGLRRVSTISSESNGKCLFDLQLLNAAKKGEYAKAGESLASVNKYKRVRDSEVHLVSRRVCLSPLGEIISSEPEHIDD